MSRRPSCSTARKREPQAWHAKLERTRQTYLVYTMFGVVIPHRALEDAGGSFAVAPRHPFRTFCEYLAQHFVDAALTSSEF
ncbi:hypothetical protein BV20DRAFT_964377 [Pilatotrama ljubarskyi]|nr:hypothetical protein BV20DRAFT_964377 [Pilatotrama ljubarskyi]